MAAKKETSENTKDTSSSESQEKLNEAVANLQKKYGVAAVMRTSDKPVNVESISTGSLSIDELLGCGGLPRGRMIELFGEESSGKSSLASFFMAQVQKNGGKAALIDAEFAFDSDYAKSIGVNVDELLVSQPQTLEEAMDTVRELAQSNALDIIVVDSVAAMVPKSELEGDEMLKDSVAVQARLLNKALRILAGVTSRSKTVVIFINQTRENIGIMFGKKETTPGGKALKFYSSVRLQVGKGEKITNDKNEQVGNKLRLTAVKNKVGFPWKKAEVDLYYGKGVDLIADLFDFAVAHEIIERKGNSYSFGDTKLGVGRVQATDALIANDDLYEQIREEALARATTTTS